MKTQEEIKTVWGKLISFTEKEKSYDDGKKMKRTCIVEKKINEVLTNIKIESSNYYDRRPHYKIKNPDAFFNNIETNWNNLKFFFSIRQKEEIGVVYVTRTINDKTKNVFRNFIITPNNYDFYLANTMSYLSQKFITNFLDVIHILKVLSHIVVISNYNGDKKTFNNILREKNRKKIIDSISVFKKKENDSFFSFLSDVAETIEYNQEIKQILLQQFTGINDTQNRTIQLMESGDCKAMVYYLIGHLKKGFDDLIAKNENYQ